MILDEGKYRVLMDPKIFLVKLDDEIEGNDLVGGINKYIRSSLRWLENLAE